MNKIIKWEETGERKGSGNKISLNNNCLVKHNS